MTNLMSERARRMRRDMSDAERRLWHKLRELNGQGFHFRQQAPIGPYIADFCDHTAKLVVEVDGAQHGEPKGVATDRRRTRWLEAQGYRVLRFWNHEPLINMAGVEVAILVALGVLREDGRENAIDAGSALSPSPRDAGIPPTPNPSPRGGGGPGLGSWRAARKEAARKENAGLNSIVPSPLVGEGQGGGDGREVKAEAFALSKTIETGSPPTPSPSPRGGGGFGSDLGKGRRAHRG